MARTGAYLNNFLMMNESRSEVMRAVFPRSRFRFGKFTYAYLR
jgi:hypothetical protein